jgi:hypothetical protein
MGEVISIREVLREIRQRRERASERESLERAVAIMKANLRAAIRELATAPQADRPELLERIERLIGMVRYGLRMLGEPHEEFDPSWLEPR